MVDYAESISAGQGQWRESYIAHGEQKRAQIPPQVGGSEWTCEVSMPAAEYEVDDHLEHCVDPKMARRAKRVLWIKG